jgi:hypothetical protein
MTKKASGRAQNSMTATGGGLLPNVAIKRLP